MFRFSCIHTTITAHTLSQAHCEMRQSASRFINALCVRLRRTDYTRLIKLGQAANQALAAMCAHTTLFTFRLQKAHTQLHGRVAACCAVGGVCNKFAMCI